MSYYTIVTRKGREKLARMAAARRALNLVEMAIGDGGGVQYDPNDAQAALKGERWRGPLNRLSVDPANVRQFLAELVVPDAVGDFYVRESAVFDEDGELFAIASLPETFKPTLPSGSNKQLTIRMVFASDNASSVRLVIDPNVVQATRQWVEERLLETLTPLSQAVAANALHDLRLSQQVEGAEVESKLRDSRIDWVDRRVLALEELPSMEPALVSLAGTVVAQGAALWAQCERLDRTNRECQVRAALFNELGRRMAAQEALPSPDPALVGLAVLAVQAMAAQHALGERLAAMELAMAVLQRRLDAAHPVV